MKKYFIIGLIICSIFAFQSIRCEQKNINQHGFTYGRLNNLESNAAFDYALQNVPFVIAKFSADWCSWCHKLTPIVQQLAREYPDILFIEIDVEKFKTLKKRYSVRGLPTTVFFKNGQQVEFAPGYKEKNSWKNSITVAFNL